MDKKNVSFDINNEKELKLLKWLKGKSIDFGELAKQLLYKEMMLKKKCLEVYREQ